MAWGKDGTPNTLGSTSDTIYITDLTPRTFNQFLSDPIGSGSVRSYVRMGNGSVDTGSNYASRVTDNGSADSTVTSDTELETAAAFSTFTRGLHIEQVINIAGEEKLLIGHFIHQRTAGASTAPDRTEYIGKWANTSNQADNFGRFNNNTGDFASDSNISALGTD